jgi:hypothetical protein
MKRIKIKDVPRREFVVINSQAEYYCGMMYGGELVWSHDYKEAKPLTDERKLITFERLLPNEKLTVTYL